MLRALSKRPTSCAITSLQAVGADLPLYFDSMLLYLCIQADAYATLIPFFYKGRYHGQMGWDWGFKASCEMEVAVVDRNKKLLRFIKIRFGGAPIKSVSPVLNEFFKPKRVNIGKAKMPKQDPICGRIGEKVT